MKKNILKCIAIVLMFCCFMPGTSVFAAEKAAVYEKYTQEDKLVLYVRGVSGTVEEISYQIGNTVCKVEKSVALPNMEEQIHTLILWDNSISVMKEYSSSLKEVLLDVVANRAANEQIAIATLEKNEIKLNEYTNDYAVLKKLVNDVNGVNKSVYINNILYQCLEDFIAMEDTGFKRIILVSDGIGEANTGYTMAELNELLSNHPYPIYTIGVGSDEKDLQNLFSLARTSNGKAFHLDEIENKIDISQGIVEDYGTLQVTVDIPEDLMDGSSHNSMLTVVTDQGSYKVECQVKMQFQSPDQQNKDEVQEPVEEPVPTEKPGREDEDEDEDEDDDYDDEEGWLESLGLDPMVVILCGIGGVVLIAAIVVLVVILSKKKKQKSTVNTFGQDVHVSNYNAQPAEEEPKAQSFAYDEDDPFESTAFLTGSTGNETVVMKTYQEGYQLQLTCVEDMAVTYRCNSSNKILIGRDSLRCNIAINGDRTVSSTHCEVFRVRDRFFIKDAGSTNGTFVEGKAISSETEIKSGNVVKIGSKEYRVTIG